jgi:photosystem II stability/assembly factor-like uncharacterized protein
MKKLLLLLTILLAVLFSFTAIAQKISFISKGFAISFPEKIHKLVLDPLPAGTYSVGSGGYFPTIDSAFNKLSIDGIAGPVTLELTDNLYIAPTDTFGFFLTGPIPGAGPNSRVTFKPAANKNVTIEGNNEVLLYLINTSFVTFDGVGLTGATTLTIHTILNNAYDFNDGIDFASNSDNNVIQNIVFINEAGSKPSGSGFVSDDAAALAPDSNLIQNNFVKQSGVALYAYGNANHIANGNIIRGNTIGTETDSLIAFGIIIFHSQNTIIENNIIQNLRLANVWDASNVGIYSFYDSGDIIRNNIVNNIKSSTGYSSVGIFLSGEIGYLGSNNQVYNNMIYDIQSTSTLFDSRVTGIQMTYQNNPKIYYNSVYLSGTGTNKYGSAGLYIGSVCSGIDSRNNILVNTRDESPYCASAIYDYTASNLTADYNDLYYEPNQYNALVRIGGNKYNTLADWQATGKDAHSYVEMPHFISSTDLHIDETIPTNIESHAIPIAGITADFDGNTRNATTPDIGADEFTGVEGMVWAMQQLPESDLMLQVKAVDLSTAWALGLHGKVFRTTDGGTTWNSVGGGLHIGAGITDCIDAISASTAFVGGLNYDPTIGPPPTNDSTFVWRTTDGGSSWQKVFKQLHGFLDAIKMTSSMEGISLGDPVGGKFTIIRTTNSGTTWSRISTEPSQMNNELGYFRSLCTYGTKYIWFGTDIGNNSSGAVYRSTDAGLSWNRVSTPFSNQVYSVCFIDSLNGICGDSVLSRSTDGGMNWSQIIGLPIGHWYNDNFPSVFVATGDGFWAVVNSGVYQSTDLGVSWNERYSATNDKFNCASLVTVGNVTAGWFTSLGTNIYACRFLNTPTDVHETINPEIPSEFKLLQNYPNPFNPSTTFRYSIPTQSKVMIKVYDILGKEIETLVNEEKPVGTYEITWYADQLPSGVYFYQLIAGEYIQTKKMLLLK